MNPRISRVVMALSLAAASAAAQAIGLNEQRFEALGGRLDEPFNSMSVVESKLAVESQNPRFRSVGELSFHGSDRTCTGTWLGEDARHTYVLTAAHCVAADFRKTPGFRYVERVTMRNDAVVFHGRGLAFIPPPRRLPGSGVASDEPSESDVAVIRLPKRQLRPLTDAGRPLLDDLGDDAHDGPGQADIEFVGYGLWRVGTKEVGRTGRLWGSVPGGEVRGTRHLLSFGYDPRGETRRWFVATSGDSGGAFWQQRWGYWRVVGTASARDARFRGFEGPRMAALAHWVKGIFPDARTLSERMTVGIGSPFVSRDHAVDVSSGSVAYLVPEQENATGPTAPTSSGAAGHSVIHVIVEDELTHHRAEVRLRGQRETACGQPVRMEDDGACGNGRTARLVVSFHPEDNPDLPRGSLVGGVEIEAVGTRDGQYRQRFPLRVRIDHLLRGEVTADRAQVLPDLMPRAPSREADPVRVALPTQADARADGTASASEGPFTRVVATVRDVLRDTDRPLVLRAYRRAAAGTSCATTTLDASTDCEGRALTGVSLQYEARDNPGLRPGLYRGRVFLEARGGPAGARLERVAVRLNIDTL
jgi:hypothetical protein